MSFILGNLVPPKKEKTKKTPMLFNLPLKKEEPKPPEPEIPVEALEESSSPADGVAGAEPVEAEAQVEDSVKPNVETEPQVDGNTEAETEPTEKKKRTRRTKAQIEADKAEVAKKEEASGEAKEDSPAPEAKIVLDDKSTLLPESPEEPEPEFISAQFEPTKLPLSKIKEVFSVEVKEESWDETLKELERRANNIRIEEDINLGAVRILLAQCTNLYSDLLRESRSNKTLYDVLLDNSIGLIKRQKEINAFGKNEDERDKNGSLSCEQFRMKDYGGKYNLYDISMVLQNRINTINDLIADVKQKKESLINYLAVLKLEYGMVK